MKITAVVFVLLIVCTFVFAQRPSDPALLVPQSAAELDYTSIADPFSFPAGMSFAGAPASVAFDSKAHVWVLTRGNPSIYEFDGNGKFIRSFGQGLFTRSHGFRFDPDGNMWATDVG